jgi:hypothetical protein
MKIRTFVDNEEFAVETVMELDTILDKIAAKYTSPPILIELKSSTFGAALVGFGYGFATIEIFTQGRDKHVRAVGNKPEGTKSLVFTYAGEHTEIPAKYSISADSGRNALRTWFANGNLDSSLSWLITEHPPKALRGK